jgi:hypothetical protein
MFFDTPTRLTARKTPKAGTTITIGPKLGWRTWIPQATSAVARRRTHVHNRIRVLPNERVPVIGATGSLGASNASPRDKDDPEPRIFDCLRSMFPRVGAMIAKPASANGKPTK